MADSRNRRLPVLRQQGWEQHRPAVEGPFPLGHLYVTPGALEAMLAASDDLFVYLTRHGQRDWGDVDEDDWLLNDAAVVNGTRLFSAYRLREGTRIWIITEADRASTTVLLPDEY